ncbi:MAG: DNA-processing protein DprA [Candidatus Paceibacterota bacterium]|jgi:DNA processing protein
MLFSVQSISINDALYPNILKKIKNPPQTLYYSGKILPKENCLAIVGSRNYSKYGQECCLKIGYDLAESGLTIVSGLARGIDSFAHQAALKAKQRTIAVLGTAIDAKNFYPKENLKIAEEILKNNGLIISEYEPGKKTLPYAFAERNRIISGLSLGVLVIEAKQKSGSLITAESAKKQNKKVFALPGNIYSTNSHGCHELIKKGAILIENSRDILKALELEHLPLTFKNDTPTKSTQEEKSILACLSEEPLHIEILIKETKLSASTVMSTLSLLEIKNKIIDLGDNTYCLNRK